MLATFTCFSSPWGMKERPVDRNSSEPAGWVCLFSHKMYYSFQLVAPGGAARVESADMLEAALTKVTFAPVGPGPFPNQRRIHKRA